MKFTIRTLMFLSLFLSIAFLPGFLSSATAMRLMTEQEMQDVSAKAGVTIYLDADVEVSFKTFGWEDLNGNKLLFRDVKLAESGGDTFHFSGPFVLDIGGISSGRSVIFNQYPGLDNVNLTIDTIEYMGNNMGSMALNGIRLSDFHLHTAGHGGLDLEIGGKLSIDNFVYNYTGGTLEFGNLEFCDNFSGGTNLYSSGGADANNPDLNPSPPGGAPGAAIDTAWTSNGSFRVGDIYNNPMTIDVGTSGSNTAIQINAPAYGSIRSKNVALGGTSFGPAAIDGIKIEMLRFTITPN